MNSALCEICGGKGFQVKNTGEMRCHRCWNSRISIQSDSSRRFPYDNASTIGQGISLLWFLCKSSLIALFFTSVVVALILLSQPFVDYWIVLLFFVPFFLFHKSDLLTDRRWLKFWTGWLIGLGVWIFAPKSASRLCIFSPLVAALIFTLWSDNSLTQYTIKRYEWWKKQQGQKEKNEQSAQSGEQISIK